MIETRAPGKLYITGEYAVVEPGGAAVLAAVDRYITVRLSEGTSVGRVRSSAYGQNPLEWVRDTTSEKIVLEHQPYDYVFAAITAIEELRSARGLAPRYFDLDIGSELDDASGRKFGLGSSAAVTVAVIAALDRFYALGLTTTERFKLALLATIEVAPNASGGDLAASTFGGWVLYRSPDRARLREHRAQHGVVATLTDSAQWAGSGVSHVPDPADLRLLVGWTGSPASTERLVEQVRTPGEKRSEDVRRTLVPYSTFAADSRECVDALVAAFGRGGEDALPVITRVRGFLQRLSASSGVLIETEQLRTLCDIAEAHGAAGKPSGAGGGDCGVVLARADAPAEPILTGWQEAGILPLDLHIHPPSGDADDF